MKKETKNSKELFFFCIVICVFLINQLPFLSDMRPVMYDEAWYGNTAYNLSIGNGLHQTSVGSGGNENCLFPLIGSLFFHLFGYSLYSLRLASVFCGVVTIIVFHFIMNELHVSPQGRSLAYLLFVCLPLFNTVFRFSRPECASMMCVALGILFYLRYWRTHLWGDIIGLCMSCILATNAHPFALYSFMFFGMALLIDVINCHEWRRLLQLMLLVLCAIIGISILFLVSSRYNTISSSSSLLGRASSENWLESCTFYFREVFISKQIVYSIPVLLILIVTIILVKEHCIRILALLTIINGLSFPFVFSTDLMMVSLGWNYVSLIAIVLLAPLIDRVLLCIRWKKLTFITVVMYCIFCLSLSYVYNYKMKYEKCNTILAKEINSFIPKDAIVYGPLRQWFCAIETQYYSDHYRYDLPDTFDFLIFNTQDMNVYENNNKVLPYIRNYELVYVKDTKQYGKVSLYRNKNYH